MEYLPYDVWGIIAKKITDAKGLFSFSVSCKRFSRLVRINRDVCMKNVSKKVTKSTKDIFHWWLELPNGMKHGPFGGKYLKCGGPAYFGRYLCYWNENEKRNFSVRHGYFVRYFHKGADKSQPKKSHKLVEERWYLGKRHGHRREWRICSRIFGNPELHQLRFIEQYENGIPILSQSFSNIFDFFLDNDYLLTISVKTKFITFGNVLTPYDGRNTRPNIVISVDTLDPIYNFGKTCVYLNDSCEIIEKKICGPKLLHDRKAKLECIRHFSGRKYRIHQDFVIIEADNKDRELIEYTRVLTISVPPRPEVGFRSDSFLGRIVTRNHTINSYYWRFDPGPDFNVDVDLWMRR